MKDVKIWQSAKVWRGGLLLAAIVSLICVWWTCFSPNRLEIQDFSVFSEGGAAEGDALVFGIGGTPEASAAMELSLPQGTGMLWGTVTIQAKQAGSLDVTLMNFVTGQGTTVPYEAGEHRYFFSINVPEAILGEAYFNVTSAAGEKILLRDVSVSYAKRIASLFAGVAAISLMLLLAMGLSQRGKSNRVVQIFVATMIGLYLIHLILLLVHPGGLQAEIFYAKMRDLLADFLNVAIYTADRNPYFNTQNGLGEKAYLPISYLFIYPFTRWTNYRGITLADCWNDPVAMDSAIFFTVVTAGLMLHATACLCKRYRVSYVLLLPVVLSAPFIHSTERGNLIFLAVAMTIYFLAFYDSENAMLRYFAAIALALASALKFYPFIFGLQYFRKKQYREIAVAAVAAVLLAFLPFLFFTNGFGNLPQWLHNLQENSRDYKWYRVSRFGIAYLVYYILPLGVDMGQPYLIADAFATLGKILVVLGVGLSYYRKNLLMELLMSVMFLFYFPANAQYYSALYLIPVLVVFLSGNEGRKSMAWWLLFLYFVIIWMPLQLPDLFYVGDISLFASRSLANWVSLFALMGGVAFLVRDSIPRKESVNNV